MPLTSSINAIIVQAKQETQESCPSVASREFLLAIDHLEMAAMRLQRGKALKAGIYPAAEDAIMTLNEEAAVHPDQLSFEDAPLDEPTPY